MIDFTAPGEGQRITSPYSLYEICAPFFNKYLVAGKPLEPYSPNFIMKRLKLSYNSAVTGDSSIGLGNQQANYLTLIVI